MRHIENPGIVRTLYSDIFRHIQGHSAYVSHGQAYRRTFRPIEAYLGIVEAYLAIFRHIQNYVNPCIYNFGLLKTLLHLEPKAATKACWTCEMIRHIQSPRLSEQFIQSFSTVLRDIQEYWCIFSHTHRCAIRGRVSWSGLPQPFWKSKKVPWFWIKRPWLCPSLG